MLKNLIDVLSSRSITYEELSKLLGIHRNTLNAKLNGDSQFTLDEIEKIMVIFKEYNFCFLFAREPITA